MLSCEIDRTLPVTVLQVDGELRLRTVSQVRVAVLKCLVECPEAVVVDLSGVVVGDRIALTVFRAVSRQAAMWPSVPLVLAAAPPDTRAQLERITSLWQIPVYPSVEEALADAALRPLPVRRLELALRAGTMALPRARAMVSEACSTWGLGDLTLPAELIMSELVSNAVQHSGTDFTASVVLRQEFLHLTVTDGCAEPPRKSPRYPPADALSGRGLLLVDEFATNWGCLPIHGGKTVWATLRIVG
ncbi:STAS domain-containing protein [Cryptosporangium minutisporangium]|uniref:ATP-binding protein n=1 Tax=Cryptosporangium minutisporangium TaxID=113569 RepID=A0ABP6TA01_9ACTN